MSQYLNLKVQEVIRETEDAVTIVFEKTKEKTSYKSGQFLTLIIPVNGEKQRRSYSLSSSPSIDNNLAVTVKKLIGGTVSTLLVDKLKKGESMEVMQPMGTFCYEPENSKKRNIILIGAGSGITPLISILKTALKEEPLSSVYLLYGNRNERSIIFNKQLEQIQASANGRLKIIHVLSQPVNKNVDHSGRLNQSSIIKLLETFEGVNLAESEYYICGPHGMMDEAKKSLEILKVPSEKIHKESFVTTTSTSQGEVIAQSGQPKDQDVTILYQGSEYKIKVPKGKTVLEAALDQDIDLPYSCQSGMCTACMGKCTHGKVQLNEPDGLSDKEIEKGYVLTCVGYPATEGVVIEID